MDLGKAAGDLMKGATDLAKGVVGMPEPTAQEKAAFDEMAKIMSEKGLGGKDGHSITATSSRSGRPCMAMARSLRTRASGRKMFDKISQEIQSRGLIARIGWNRQGPIVTGKAWDEAQGQGWNEFYNRMDQSLSSKGVTAGKSVDACGNVTLQNDGVSVILRSATTRTSTAFRTSSSLLWMVTINAPSKRSSKSGVIRPSPPSRTASRARISPTSRTASSQLAGRRRSCPLKSEVKFLECFAARAEPTSLMARAGFSSKY